ncbi:PREDICTED: E-selectin-like [Branchiostoma belcheri]|uniref:E-selectin-like n=1 Tax=Branchiostoma belcheri TaxID=7741 RepID=A0A6P4Y6X1_BRABE|nr:PREDICTED: E-selectin-like [Branchiostoma belcheri]
MYSVVIFNRFDCCQSRLNPFNIHIGDSSQITLNPKCGGDHYIDLSQPSISVSCQGMSGRYVGVVLPGSSRTMTLCEVQVFEGSAVQCPTLSNPSNGGVSYSSRNYGDVATYSCNTGYSLNGFSTRTCQSSGSWSNTAPTCQAVQCPTLSNPSNGGVSYSSRNYGDVATYSCNTGYSLNGFSTRTCQSSGSWSNTAPTCDAVQCSTLSNPSNGGVSYSSRNYGDVATYSCNTGYSLNGFSTRTCQSSGSWSNTAPTCQAVQCPTLSNPSNGGVSYSSRNYGDVATYSCNTGYSLNGFSTRTCQSSGSWSNTAPTCDAGQCPVPTSPPNGAVSYSSRYDGDVATFSCDPGYNLVGSSTITCQSNLLWSGGPPTCSEN